MNADYQATISAGSPDLRTHESSGFEEFRTGWRVVLGALLGAGLGAPTVPFYTIGILAPSLAAEFGWSYSTILGGLFLVTVALLPLGPLVGYLADRYGPRVVGATALVLLGLSFMCLAFSTGSTLQYSLTWGMIAIAGAAATPITFTRAVNAIFVRRRGLALGLMLSGPGTFMILVKLFGHHLVDAFGWRVTVVAIGALPVIIAAPAVLWAFRSSSSSSAVPLSPLPKPSSGLTLGEALRNWRFWLLAVSFIPAAFATAAPVPNMENILTSLKIPVGDIALITSVIGGAQIFGRICGGWLLDRVWAPVVAFVMLSGAAYGAFLLSQASITEAGAFIAVGLLGLTMGLELDLMSYLVARFMGLKHYSAIYGVLYALFFTAAGAGPGLMARSFDKSGSYGSIMAVCAVALLFSGGILLFIGRYPKREACEGT